jgi:hypothetical protein
MSSKSRGGLSKREYAAKVSGGSGGAPGGGGGGGESGAGSGAIGQVILTYTADPFRYQPAGIIFNLASNCKNN